MKNINKAVVLYLMCVCLATVFLPDSFLTESCYASTECLSIDGDLNDDCMVDIADLLLLASQWLDEQCSWPNCADVDDYLGVDFFDFNVLANRWMNIGSPVVINEFMARNDTTITDDDGHYSDWIELHNISSAAVDLSGWFLTNDSDASKRWQLPTVMIEPGQYLIVYSSGKDRNAPSSAPHTDFQLEGQGEYLALLWPDGSIAHQYAPEFPMQAEDVSYGLSYNNTVKQYVEAFFTTATPGAINSTSQTDIGPAITDVTHLPNEPLRIQHVTISARVSEKISAISSVELFYRVMYAPEQSVTMLDDGLNGDALAGDGIFSAVIPAETAASGEMVRYYFLASDDMGFQSRLPLALDQNGEDQAPGYFGMVVADTEAASDLPVLHWFVENASASETRSGTHASLCFEGNFYDNIFVRIRGSAAASWPKHKFKFDFYGDVFKYDKDFPATEEINLQSYYREVLNSGNTSYMRENMAYQFLRNADVPACNTKHLQVRRNGDYYGLFSFIEQVDETFLKRHGYDPEGLLYKSINCCSGTLMPLSLGSYPSYYRKITNQNLPYDNLYDFTHNINVSNPDRFKYLFDNIDLPQVINYMAAQCVMTNHDRLTKNYHIYREPETLLWHLMPWDLDQSFNVGNYLTNENWTHPFYGNATHTQELSGGGPNPNWQNHIYTVMFDNPNTQQMYLRRLRTLMDKYLVDNSAYFTQMALEYYNLISAEADKDNAKWSAGNITKGYEEIVETNLPTRRDQLQNIYSSAGMGIIPDSQPSDFAVNFAAIEYNPVSGNQDEEYIELVNPNNFAIDISDYKITGGIDFTFQSGTVIPALSNLYVVPSVSAFRNRAVGPAGNQGLFVQGNYSGHLSSWGETLYLLDTSSNPVDEVTYASDPSDQQRYLRVTEIMYHPSASPGAYAADDFEFIELMNISDNPLDLAGVKFIDGITFDFSGTTQTEGDVSLINLTDTWKYDQSDSALTEQWKNAGFNDSDWLQGPALLYHETSALPAPKNTPLALGATTYYFRKTFYLDADPTVDTITLAMNTVIDDGAVFYLNGVEVYRLGMPDGTIEHSTFASRSASDAVYEGPFDIDASSMLKGNNTFAVEVHQRISNSSDIVMGISLEANIIKNSTPSTTSLAGRDFLLLVKNIAAFSERYPESVAKIAGQYSGNLNNGGENIKIKDSTNSTILDFSYNDNWYSITDGGGYSLEIQNPDNADLSIWDNSDGWHPGSIYGGSPGTRGTGNVPAAGSVIVNEVLAHSDTYPNDWIELHNTTDQPINIGGWFLSDNDDTVDTLKKYEIPVATIIEPNGYIVFTQDAHFGNTLNPGCHTAFALSENGEEIYLSSGENGQLSGYYYQQKFTASLVGVSIGIHLKSNGTTNFVAMEISTPDSANSNPMVGPLVISEIMYNPTASGTYHKDEYEYIELVNISDLPVSLSHYDAKTAEYVSWQFTDGIDYVFPQGASIPAGGKALVVNNISAFNKRYGIIWGTQLFGPFANESKLSDSGEKIQLSMPGDVDKLGQRQYIRVDRVKYSDGSVPTDPWPTEADGKGSSLTRIALDAYGNDVANFRAADPTPGQVN